METKITASELNNLSNTYLGNTMGVGVTQYFLKTAQDPDIIKVLESTFYLAKFATDGAKRLLSQARYPHPEGFSSKDFTYTAPALYNDNIILLVKHILTQDASSIYAVSLSASTTSDVRKFYLECVTLAANLIDKIVEVMEKKGLFHPKIYIPIPETIEKVQKQSYINGWFSGRRSLNALEVMQIISNFTNVEVEREFLRSFIQTTSSKQLREHFKRGEEIARKHMDIFQNLLKTDKLPQLPTWESEITESTVAPVSDRLMLYKISVFVSSSMARYGTAVSTVMRKDLAADFTRMTSELALYGEDTLNLMIEMGFLDQIPLTKDKD